LELIVDFEDESLFPRQETLDDVGDDDDDAPLVVVLCLSLQQHLHLLLFQGRKCKKHKKQETNQQTINFPEETKERHSS
jgi:hypothetical protein